jgi:hypothetical protein
MCFDFLIVNFAQQIKHLMAEVFLCFNCIYLVRQSVAV